MSQIQIISDDRFLRDSFKVKPLDVFLVSFNSSIKNSLALLTKKAIDIIILDFRSEYIISDLNLNFFLNKVEQYHLSFLVIIGDTTSKEHSLLKNHLLQDVFCTNNRDIDIFSFYFFLKINIQLFKYRLENFCLKNTTNILLHQEESYTSYYSKEHSAIISDTNIYPFHSFLLGESNAIKLARRSIYTAIGITQKSLVSTEAISGNILIIADTGLEKENIAHYIAFTAQSRMGLHPNIIEIDFKDLPQAFAKYVMISSQENITSEFDYLYFIENFSNGLILLHNVHLLTWEGQTLLMEVLDKRESIFFGKKMSQFSLSQIIFTVTPEIYYLIERGYFRQDLLSKISSFVITIPTLEEREYDIIQIAEQYVQYYQKKYNKSILMTPLFKLQLVRHLWKDNLDTLYRFLLEYCSTSSCIIDDLDALKKTRLDIYSLLNIEIQPKMLKKIDHKEEILNWFSGEVRNGVFQPSLEDLEQAYIRLVLEHYKGNIAEAARVLGIARKTLYSKLK